LPSDLIRDEPAAPFAAVRRRSPPFAPAIIGLWCLATTLAHHNVMTTGTD
jgi:hypothetical protein